MGIEMIVAMGRKQEIGQSNKLLWHLPGDFKWFKKKTMYKNIIMGRKTYESIGKLLPFRNTFILTHDKDYHVEGATIIHRPFDLDMTQDYIVIGGSEVYKLYLDHASELHITHVGAYFPDADTFFPDVWWNLFEPTIVEMSTTENYPYTIKTYKRIIYGRKYI